jgi:biopolymer transport protein ExbD
MAGGGTLGGGGKAKRGKHSKRKKKKRVGFVLDMTPLVDITFLLLTFFMFTTTMMQPQVMEMKLPPELYEETQVDASKLFTLLLRGDGELFWYKGKMELKQEPLNAPVKVSLDTNLRKLAEEENLQPKVRNQLITVLRIEDDAQFDKVVGILDYLNQAEIKISEVILSEKNADGTAKFPKRDRRFTIAPLEEDEKEYLRSQK